MIIEAAESGDRALVLDSWLNGQRHSPGFSWVPNGIYFKRMEERINGMLLTETVLVARPTSHVAEDGTRDIAGFVCGRRDPLASPGRPSVPLVHWMAVKEPYRGKGLHVGLSLLRALGWAEGLPVVCSAWSAACERVAPGSLIYRPSLARRRGAKSLPSPTNERTHG